MSQLYNNKMSILFESGTRCTCEMTDHMIVRIFWSLFHCLWQN